MTIDKRIERNTQSLFALRILLRDVNNNPASYIDHKLLRDSLRSQGALAKHNDESKCIYSSSLNTIKRIAESSLEGGFDTLDKLRIGAYEALLNEEAKGMRSNKSSKTGLSKRVKELEKENLQLRQDMLLLTLALDTSLAQGKNYASKTDVAAIIALCKREQREILATLSLRRYPAATNVKKLREN